MGRKNRTLNRRRCFIVLITLIGLGYFWIRRGNSSQEEEEEDSEHMTKRVREIEEARKAEEDFQYDYNKSLSKNDSTELSMGYHRYKLFKNRRLPYKAAFSFCKKMDGQLPLPDKVENLRKLQTLIEKNIPSYDDGYGHKTNVWVGRLKPKKRKKGGEEGDYMNSMMMGGGGSRGEEQCPGLTPKENKWSGPVSGVPCSSPLQFICEFHRNTPRKPEPDRKKGDRYGRYGDRFDDEL